MASSARIEELRKKFEENPRRYFAPLANEYRKAGDIEQAVAICREYLPQQPGHMSGHIVYGQALYEARQFEESKTVFETALSLDPENLIALRHLGDIALIVGDSEAARGWYRRVLEADPRNEEIQAQLAALDLSVSESPTPVATPAEPESPLSTDPSSAPTVVVQARGLLTPLSTPAVPSAAANSPALAPTAEVVLDNLSTTPTAEVHLDAPGGSGSPHAFESPVQGLDLESPVAGASAQDQGLISGFSLEGLESTSFTPPSGSAESPAESESSSQELPFVEIETTAAPPNSGPVVSSAPVAELDLGVPAAAEPPASAPVAEAPKLEQPAAAAPIVAPTAAPAAEGPAIDFVEIPDAPSPAGSGAFITETMAELYLKQGHREEALRVYRALLEQRPGDAGLRARVAELEPPSGPTIREVLKLLALRRPGYRANGQHTNGASAAADVVTSAASEPRTAPMTVAELPTEPMTPVDASPVPESIVTSDVPTDGSLSDLFGGAPVTDQDETAATALAYGFAGSMAPGGVLESPDAAGAPAHPATNELSLDAVFGGGKGSVAAPSSFSFDQFFSRRATTPPASGIQAPAEANANPGEDLADFTQWLEGLKQK